MLRINKEPAFSLVWDRTHLENIILQMPNFAFWKNVDGIYMGCNENYAHFLGLRTPAEIIGKTDYQLGWKNKDQAATILQQQDRAILNGKTIENEELLLSSPTGKTMTVLLNKTPLLDRNAQLFGIMGICINITEFKKFHVIEKSMLERMANEEATKRALLIFSGMLTHDLRTPLLSASLRANFIKKILPKLIRSYETAKEAGLDVPEINKKNFELLEDSTDSIMESINEANSYIDSSLKSLKGAAQGENLLSKEQLVHCNAGNLVQRLILNYPCSEEDRKKIHFDFSNDFNFLGNEIFFNRLLENLIKNAFEQIQFKGNKGEIFISFKRGNSNLIKIKDTAGGVTKNILSKCTEEFQSYKEGGTGVGLASAQQIMKAFGGSITSHIAHDNYIEFILSFPILNEL